MISGGLIDKPLLPMILPIIGLIIVGRIIIGIISYFRERRFNKKYREAILAKKQGDILKLSSNPMMMMETSRSKSDFIKEECPISKEIEASKRNEES